MSKIPWIAALILTGCSASKNLSSQSIDVKNTSTAGIIGGYQENSKKISDSVYRYSVEGGNCSSVQMQDGLVITANHCLTYNGGAREFGIFYGNDPNETIGSKTLFSFKNQAAEKTIVADDIAVAIFPEGQKPHQGFLYPTTSDLPEELYIAGYGRDTFAGYSDNAEWIPLRSLALSKSKQLLKSLAPQETGFDFGNVDSEVQEELHKIDEQIKTGKLLCFKPSSTKADSPNHGDSGGPLFSLDENGTPVLRGIFSTFVGPSDQTFFYCYTNVVPYIDWLQGIKKNWEDLVFKNKIEFKTTTKSLAIDSLILGGISFTPRSVSGKLVDLSLGRPEDIRGLDLTGKIALIRRGEISFSDKIYNATAAGAVGIVFYNNDPAAEKSFFMAFEWGRKEQITSNPLDARMISARDGQTLVETLKSGEQIEVTLSIP